MEPSSKFGKVGVIVSIGLAVAALYLFQSSVRLRRDNARLKRASEQLAQATTEARRLSELLSQARAAQLTTGKQLQELIALRAEVNRLRHGLPAPARETEPSAVEDHQTELASLRAEVARLTEENEELEALREQLQQLRTAASTATTNEDRGDDPNSATESQPLAIRTIRTQGEAFAQKLKRTAGAGENEGFTPVYTRFLEANGIPSSALGAAVFDERTGTVIIRANQGSLDQIEQLTHALDQSP